VLAGVLHQHAIAIALAQNDDGEHVVVTAHDCQRRERHKCEPVLAASHELRRQTDLLGCV
jgi:hypothetical protein